MILFWFLIGLMTVAAILFATLPLLRNPKSKQEAVNVNTLNINLYKQELQLLKKQLANNALGKKEYENLRTEKEKALLQDTFAENAAQTSKNKSIPSALILFFLVPLFAISLYLKLGDSQALSQKLFIKTHAAQIKAQMADLKTPQKMIAFFKKQLKHDPSNLHYWYWLGRLYMNMRKFPEAVQAFKHATLLKPNDPKILYQQTQAIFLANDYHLTPKAQRLIARLKKISPNYPDLLNLLASNAYRNGKHQTAIHYWELLLQQLPSDSPNAKMLLEMIAKTQKLKK